MGIHAAVQPSTPRSVRNNLTVFCKSQTCNGAFKTFTISLLGEGLCTYEKYYNIQVNVSAEKETICIQFRNDFPF